MEYVIFFPICRVPSSAVNIGRKFFFLFFYYCPMIINCSQLYVL